jgi:hypothetical protein
MLGSTHFIAGAATGKLTKNPFLAVAIGFLIHFLMDAIPHWDLGYFFCSRWPCYVMAASDPISGIIFFAILGIFLRFDKKMWVLTLLGGLASIAPDALNVFIKTFQIEQLRWFMELHAMAHTLRPFHGDVFAWNMATFTFPQMIWGLLVQAPFWFVSIWILIRNDKKKKTK